MGSRMAERNAMGTPYFSDAPLMAPTSASESNATKRVIIPNHVVRAQVAIESKT